MIPKVLINANFSSEQELRNTLDFIYSRSQEGKSFHGLLEVAFNEVTIVTAIHKIKANKGSLTAGLDKKNINYYLQMPREQVISLVKESVVDYKPRPVRRVYILKSNGKKRPLGVATILDRIIQECIRIVLEPIVEAKFYPHSYGFRPERACKHAISDIVRTISNGGNSTPVYVIEGDIKGFFDNVNHRILINKLFKIGVHDKRILAIIKKMLVAGYFEENKVNETTLGTAQGSILSPLLANVYLNDFDWMVGRLYQETRHNCYATKGFRRTLRRRGVVPKYLQRYCDDWVVLTTTEQEAKRFLLYLKDYFIHRLKLELSEEKTTITNITQTPAKFLSFLIKAEPPKALVGKTPKRKLVGKNYPNFEKVKKQVRTICNKLKELKNCANEGERAAIIENVNSIIIGIMEYWKTGICSKTYKYIDHKIFISALNIFKKLYPETMKNHIKPLNSLDNRRERHKGYRGKTWAVKVDNVWIGITKAAITHSQWELYPFNQKITPYSMEGRKLIESLKHKRIPKPRPPLYGSDVLTHVAFRDGICNFEYYMNREYAYNRDKGRCRLCSKPLKRDDRICHRIDRSLDIQSINKVSNLVWVHNECYKMINSKSEVKLPANVKRKLEKFRHNLNQNP